MLRPGQAIALCVISLLTLGVVMVNSAGMAITPVGGSPGAVSALTKPDAVTFSSIVLSRTSLYMVMALMALAAGAMTPIRQISARLFAGRAASSAAVESPLGPSLGLPRRGSPAFTLACLCVALIGVVVLAYVPGLGREINGSHRWLRLPIPGLGDTLSVQPSEIVKWAFVGVIAWFAAIKTDSMHRFFGGLLPALMAVAVVAGAVILEDLGTGVLIGAAATIVLLAGGARLRHFLMFVPFGVAGLAAAIISNPYRIDRIKSFINPYLDPQFKGYHMIQSMLAVSGGEGAGRGLGHGLQKFGYLPEDKTDFLFAVICEELGIAGAAIVIFLFLGLVWTGIGIVRRERDPFLKLLGIGLISTVGLQALINLAVVTGLGPTKGIALPLVSSGGTGWILTAFSLGLLSAIDRTQPNAPQEAPSPSLAAA